VFDTLEPYIERRYGVPVIINDVADPFTGDLDGSEIHVDYANELETAVFIIAHLFGHTVQWNLSEYARHIGDGVQNPSDEKLAELEAYEREACSYSLQLFHDAGVADLDQWVADLAACDWAYLKHFYKTGEKRPFRSFWKDGQPPLEPRMIPDFHPTRWLSRWQGIVVWRKQEFNGSTNGALRLSDLGITGFRVKADADLLPTTLGGPTSAYDPRILQVAAKFNF
jgi:hypothetical protein